MAKIVEIENEKYRPDVSGHNDDDGERTEPGVPNGKHNIARDLRACEVLERKKDHAQGQGQRDQVEDPHLSVYLKKTQF